MKPHPTPGTYLCLSLSVLPIREFQTLDKAPVWVIRHSFGAFVHVPPSTPPPGDQEGALPPDLGHGVC
jgi:hypothetical protein